MNSDSQKQLAFMKDKVDKLERLEPLDQKINFDPINAKYYDDKKELRI